MDSRLIILAGLGLFLWSRASEASYNQAWTQPGGLDWTDYLLVALDSGAQVEQTGNGEYIDTSTGVIVDPERVASVPVADTSPEVIGVPPSTRLDDSEIPLPPSSGFMTVGYDVNSNNVPAFLRLIRHGESGQGDDAYNMIVFGGTFDDYSDHPRVLRPIPGTTKKTSAAGAYQITMSTWDDLQKTLHLPDFSPASQDKAAVALIKRRGALDDIVAGRYEAAIVKCQKEWTSLPGAAETRYGMAKAKQVLAQWGASFDNGGTVTV